MEEVESPAPANPDIVDTAVRIGADIPVDIAEAPAKAARPPAKKAPPSVAKRLHYEIVPIVLGCARRLGQASLGRRPQNHRVLAIP